MWVMPIITSYCGGGEIRTHDTVTRMAHFKCAGINHYPTPPSWLTVPYFRSFFNFCYTVPMKYLGIDFGTKRVGVAVSDDSATLARPVAVFKNDSALYDELNQVIAHEGVGTIVVGNSAGNPVQFEIDEFIATITLSTMMPVETMTEAFSSMEAHGGKGKERMAARANKAPQKPTDLDARAAAVILQRYLDTKSRKK